MRGVKLPRRLDHGEEASLVEHLEELRGRLFVVIAAMSIASVIGFAIHTYLIRWLALDLPPKFRHFETLGPLDAFSVTLWISIYFGFALSLPIIFWQLWSFFIPAVAESKAKLMRWLILLAWVLAIGGLSFGYFLVLPAALKFLTGYNSHDLHYIPIAKNYLGFCVHVLIAMTIVFELPVFMVGLTRLGILTTTKIRQNRRIGYFACGVAGMAVAPSVDPVTTVLQAVPLFVLFEGSIWLCAFLDRRERKSAEAAAS